MDQFTNDKEKELQQKMSQLLVRIRLANGIKNPFLVTRELGLSTATLSNIEKGVAFPTTKTLNDLIDLYIMTPYEKKEALQLKNDMLKLRRERKELRKRER